MLERLQTVAAVPSWWSVLSGIRNSLKKNRKPSHDRAHSERRAAQ
ncbi:hypothetical protein APA386B_2588 [Acetobacter pasteurianus 386B]|nr:hypothetical protein APA386B_2588 [Acetobacter pasteurianus 386B]